MDLIPTNKVDVDGNPIYRLDGATREGGAIYRTGDNGTPAGEPHEWRSIPVHEMWPGPLRPASDVEPSFRPERKRIADGIRRVSINGEPDVVWITDQEGNHRRVIPTGQVDMDGNPMYRTEGDALFEPGYVTASGSIPVGAPAGWKPTSNSGLQEFPSGAKRNALEGKPRRYDQVPIVGLRRVAETAAEGVEHYGVGSSWWWHQGKAFPSSSLLGRAMEHIEMYRAGNRDEDHLAHACWNLMVLMQNEEQFPEQHDIVMPPLGGIHPRT